MTRDDTMAGAVRDYPHYGFDRHKPRPCAHDAPGLMVRWR
jgi:hypothetical protein